MKTIKRYGNRKLYDADVGYVNLTNLVEYVKDGVDFEVVEHKNGQRVITSEILSMALHVHIQREKTEKHQAALLSIIRTI